jgi:glycosyltransferase involved in cell wall biosynthesis
MFTSVLDLETLPAHYRSWEIHESGMARLPGVNRYHRGLLPLYPPVFRSFHKQLREFDVVLADSSAWSHHARGRDDALHLCYCHSPARFLHRDANYLEPAALPRPVRAALRPVLAGLRPLDRRAAQRVDAYIANSRTVKQRIRQAYDREACVVYPPVDVERFICETPAPAEPWFLAVSRLVPHKRIDLAVEACTRAGIPLKVVGSGRTLEKLREMAGPTVEFLGWQSDEAVADLLRRCRAFILPGAEDFGITAVEAQAAGRPVVAYGAGGALESVIDGETGLFFSEPTAASLQEVMERFARHSWDADRLRANAQRFTRAHFQERIAGIVERQLKAKRGAG